MTQETGNPKGFDAAGSANAGSQKPLEETQPFNPLTGESWNAANENAVSNSWSVPVQRPSAPSVPTVPMVPDVPSVSTSGAAPTAATQPMVASPVAPTQPVSAASSAPTAATQPMVAPAAPTAATQPMTPPTGNDASTDTAATQFIDAPTPYDPYAGRRMATQSLNFEDRPSVLPNASNGYLYAGSDAATQAMMPLPADPGQDDDIEATRTMVYPAGLDRQPRPRTAQSTRTASSTLASSEYPPRFVPDNTASGADMPAVAAKEDEDAEGNDQKTKSKKGKIIAIIVVIVLVCVAVGFGIKYFTSNKSSDTASTGNALTDCQNSVTAYNTARDRWNTSVSNANSASAVTADQVADSSTVDNLARALSADVPQVTQCDASMSDDKLKQATSLNKDAADTLQTNADAVDNAAAAVTTSKSTKDGEDAAASAAASSSAAAEADAAAVSQARDQLKTTIDTANALLATATTTLGATDANVVQLQGDIANAESVRDDDSSDVASLNASQTTLQNDITVVQNAITAAVDKQNQSQTDGSGATSSASTDASSSEASAAN